MSGQLRISSPLTQLATFLGLFGVAFVFTGIIMIVLSMSAGNMPTETDLTDPSQLSLMKFMQGLSSITIFLLPAIAFSLIAYSGNYWKALGIKKPVDNRMYLIAVLVVVLGFPFLYLLSEINGLVPLPQWMIEMEERTLKQMMAFLKMESLADILINLLIIAVLPAICEEICFRGALQNIMIRLTKKPITGILLAAVVFSALHFQFQGFLPRFYLGAVLGLLYWYSGSLWPSILAHFINNGVQVIMVAYAPEYVEENPESPVWAGIASGIIIGYLMYLYIKWSEAGFAKVASEEENSNTLLHGQNSDEIK